MDMQPQLHQQIACIEQALRTPATDATGPLVNSEGVLLLRSGALLTDEAGGVVSKQRYFSAVHNLAEELARISDPEQSDEQSFATSVQRPFRPQRAFTKKTTLLDVLDELERSALLCVIKAAEENGGNRSELLTRCATLRAYASRSLGQLVGAVEHQHRNDPTILDTNRQVLFDSWKYSRGDISEAVLNALQLKRIKYGTSHIVIWHDIDQNLTVDESHNDTSPGVRHAKLAYQEFGRQLLEPVIFGGFYDHMYNTTLGSYPIGKMAYESVGTRAIDRHLLQGVKETFSFSAEKRVDRRLLTRNLRWMGDGFARGLDVPEQHVYGRLPHDHSSTNKPMVLMRALLSDPSAVHIMVDDGDESLVAAVSKQLDLDGSTIADHIFMITRGDVEDRRYPLGGALRSCALPHGSQSDSYDTVFQVVTKAAHAGRL